MVEPIFRFDKGQVMEVLPEDPDGTPRVPDGKRYLTLAQAARKSGRSEQYLYDTWMATWAEVLGLREPQVQGPKIGQPPNLVPNRVSFEMTTALGTLRVSVEADL